MKDSVLLRKLIRSAEAPGNPVSVPIPAPTAYLRLEFWVRGDQAHGPSFVQYYVPARGLVSAGPAHGARTPPRSSTH